VIGILGGTFDPPHLGHLAIANATFDQLALDKILLMPAGRPWQKADHVLTDAGHRLAMTKLAASEVPYLVVDDREIRREGPTYTIDTVEAMTEPCVLIIGADTAVGLSTWHRGVELLEKAAFAIVARSGITAADVDAALGGRYTLIDLPPIDISSTQIRDHISRGHSPRFLVSEAVAAYIETNGLYRSPTSAHDPVPIITVDE